LPGVAERGVRDPRHTQFILAPVLDSRFARAEFLIRQVLAPFSPSEDCNQLLATSGLDF